MSCIKLRASVGNIQQGGDGSVNLILLSCAAGVLALLECLRHLSAPDCHGATLLMQSMGGQAAQQQQRASPQPLGSGLLGALLGLVNERHIAALQVGMLVICVMSGAFKAVVAVRGQLLWVPAVQPGE